MRRVSRPLCLLAVVALFAGGCAHRRVQPAASWASTNDRGFTVRVNRDPFYIEASDSRGVLLRTAPASEDGRGSLAFLINGAWDPAVRVVEEPRDSSAGEIILMIELRSGTRAAVKFIWDTRTVLRIEGQIFPYQAADGFALWCETDESEHFYGFGDVWNGSLDQRGKKIRMWVRTGTPDECCYVPFFMSTKGYGLLVSNYHHGTFDMAASAPDRFGFEFSDRALQLRLFYGPSPADIVSEFTRLTGRPPLPPRWVFEPWKWRNRVESYEQVYEDAEGFRDNDIPCGVIFIDNPWMEYGINSFVFDSGQFPDPQRMIDDLHAMGYRLLVWACPWTTTAVPHWREGAERGYFVLDETGGIFMDGQSSYVDFTNPEARTWWQSQINKVLDMGIDGFKLDRGQKIPENTFYYDGSIGTEMHNKYALYFVGTYYEACRAARGDDFTLLPRAGCLQSQRFSPSKWPGDCTQDFNKKQGMPPNVIAMLSAGLCGFAYWGSDIGGFEGPDLTKTVLLRWLQHGALSPIMQVGGNAPREPWDTERFDQETLDIYREWSWLRQELIPYVYSYAHIAAENGEPIARPLAYSFPLDEGGYGQNYEYMFGDWLLVAPVMNYEGSRDVYLPPGRWVDYWTDEVHDGPKTLAGYTVPLHQAPLFVRAGALIPLDVERSCCGHGSERSTGHVTVLSYPLEDGEFYLRDRDIDATLRQVRQGAAVTISWERLAKPLLLRVMTEEPSRVASAGQDIPRLESEEALFNSPAGWYYDGGSHRCIIRIAATTSGDLRIVR